jgi:hypothetical protein
MSFNFKRYIEKTAAKQPQTTEGQLYRKSKTSDKLQEGQLDKNRSKAPDAVFEKQLEKVRSDNTIFYTTEGQLENRCDAPEQTSEAQLGENRCKCSPELTEKTLGTVRKSGFNLKSYLTKTATKKSKVPVITERQLDNDEKGPNSTTDFQLDGLRSVKEGSGSLIENTLEKSRTGEPAKLLEGLLDESKSKLVQHRNPKTAQGAINKLDEQRMSNKKAEKYEPASETDKDMMLPEVKGEDGLRTANKHIRITKVAQVPGVNQFGNGLNQEAMKLLAQYHIGPHDLFRYDTPNSEFQDVYEGIQAAKQGDIAALKTALKSRFGQPSLMSRVVGSVTASTNKLAQYDYPVEPGILERPSRGWSPDFDEQDQFEEFSPDLDQIDSGLSFPDEEKEYGALIEQLTSGIEVPDEEEIASLGLSNPDEIDDSEPNFGVKSDDPEEAEEVEEEYIEDSEDFNVESSQDLSVGKTEMRQVVLSFDPNRLKDKFDVKQRAISFLYSKYPKLFSAKIKGKQVEVSQNLNINMYEGRITTTLPKSVF